MNFALTALIALVLTLPLPGVEIDPLPADTAWVLALDVQQTLKGPLGEVIRTEAARPETAPKLKLLTVISGFDPLRDCDRVVVSGTGFAPSDAAILLTGRFDGERLTTIVQAADGYRTLSHGALTIHTWKDKDKPGQEVFACLSGNRLALANSEATLRRSLDALTANTAPSGPVAAAKAQNGTVVLAASADRLQDLPRRERAAQVLQQVDRATLTARAEGEAMALVLTVVAVDETAASRFQQMAQGLLALLAMAQDPNLPAEAVTVAQSLQITREQASVRFSALVPVALLRDAMAKRHAADK